MTAVFVVNWNDMSASIRALQFGALAGPASCGFWWTTLPTSTRVMPSAPAARGPLSSGSRPIGVRRGVQPRRRVAARRGATHVLIMNNDAVLAPDALDQLIAADADSFPGACWHR